MSEFGYHPGSQPANIDPRSSGDAPSANRAAADEYTAVAGNKIVTLFVYCDTLTAGVFDLGVYITSSAIPTTKIGSGQVTCTTTPGWRSGTVSITPTWGPVRTLAAGWISGAPRIYYDDGGTASVHNAAGGLPATWVEDTTYPVKQAVYAVVISEDAVTATAAGAASIVEVAAFIDAFTGSAAGAIAI